jgi:hypothetical protein
MASIPAAKSLSVPNLPRTPLKLGSCVNLLCKAETSLLIANVVAMLIPVAVAPPSTGLSLDAPPTC